jgi:hypothetical protein
MTVRQRRFGSLVAVALLSAACGPSDGLLAPDFGRVRFVLGAAESPLALAAPTSGSGEARADSAVASMPDTAIVDPWYPPYRPVPMFESAEVTFSSILARDLDGVLVHVDMELPVTVEVSVLETGSEIELPEGELPVGTYDEVVFVMRKVQVVLWDGTRVTIEPAGGGWTAHVPLCPPVEVENSATATVSLEVQIWNAIAWYGDRWHFEPQPLFYWPGHCWDGMPPPLPM